MVLGLKQLKKEDLGKVCLKLSNKLSTLRLDQININLSASAKPFVPLATSSVTATGVPPSGCTATLLRGNAEVTRPLYMTDDDGFMTDAASLKKKKNQWGSSGKNCGCHHATSDTGVSDSGSDTSASSAWGRQGKKKKAGVNNKVNIPKFGGKDTHPHDVACAFRSWVSIVAHYQDYYEDEYLMTQVIVSARTATPDAGQGAPTNIINVHANFPEGDQASWYKCGQISATKEAQGGSH